MKTLTLIRAEFQKIRRSKILLILLASSVILWLPSAINAEMNFTPAMDITPENNFFIQGFLGMSWFIFPAVMAVCTVLLNQTERTNNGILKMLALPVSTASLCFAKFIVLLFLGAIYSVTNIGAYYISAAAASWMLDYNFLLNPGYILAQTAVLFLSAIPMTAVFWLIAVCISTPVFSVGIGLASIVPSMLIVNTKFWFLYPMGYPIYVIVTEYGKLAADMDYKPMDLIPWLPAAGVITVLCLAVSCFCFGRSQRR